MGKKVFFILFFFLFFSLLNLNTVYAVDPSLNCAGDCENVGEYCGTCLGEQQSCPSDSGVMLPYQCSKDHIWEPLNSECQRSCITRSTAVCKNITIQSGRSDTRDIQYHYGSVKQDSGWMAVTFQVSDQDNFKDYVISNIDAGEIGIAKTYYDDTGKKISASLLNGGSESFAFSPGVHSVTVRKNGSPQSVCQFNYTSEDALISPTPSPNLLSAGTGEAFKKCTLTVESDEVEGKKFTSKTGIRIVGNNLPSKSRECGAGNLICIEGDIRYRLKIRTPIGTEIWINLQGDEYPAIDPNLIDFGAVNAFTSNSIGNFVIPPLPKSIKFDPAEASYQVELLYSFSGGGNVGLYKTTPVCGKVNFQITNEGSADGHQSNTPKLPDLAPLCEQVGAKHKSGEGPTDCEKCIDPDVSSDYKGIWTAIGCVPTDMKTLLERYVFTYGISIAGGIAFLYFLYGCFLILTSMGNAERINQGKEIIISSLSGLLLIIFSVLILTIIGVDLLQIPGFSRS